MAKEKQEKLSQILRQILIKGHDKGYRNKSLAEALGMSVANFNKLLAGDQDDMKSTASQAHYNNAVKILANIDKVVEGYHIAEDGDLMNRVERLERDVETLKITIIKLQTHLLSSP